ncbi:MAG: transposase [Thermodesulfobacteriota bacterium]|nr:transposase [Thermodesulfobacteriota bacterium]
MARPLRIEYPGAFYHIINRGNSGESIYIDDSDRHKFLDYLEMSVERFALVIHAYCLMTNHYHLIVETPNANISSAIQWLNVSYVTYYNRKHHRQGHLFQGRFKSILINADEYLLELSRYIHRNPVAAMITKLPDDYPWSSYRAYVQEGKTISPWLERDRLLSYFETTTRKAMNRYRRFVEEINEPFMEEPTTQAVAGSVLGNESFITWIQETFLKGRTDDREIPQVKALRPNIPIATVIRTVAEACGCEEITITEKGRKSNRAREYAIYLSRDLCGLTNALLGQQFGGISGAAVTLTCNKVIRSLQEDIPMRIRLEEIRRQILNI